MPSHAPPPLSRLQDVAIANPNDGQLLVYDAATAKWKNRNGGSLAADTLWDAKGDIVAGTGPDAAAKVVVGADALALVADSTQAAGVKWAAPAPAAHKASHLGGSDDLLPSLSGFFLRQLFVSGRYYGNPLILPAVTGSQNNVLAANGMSWALPWPLPAGVVFNRIGIQVITVGSAGSVVRLMIYGPDNTGSLAAVPLQLDAGTIDSAGSTGAKEITINWTVPSSGIYYVMAVAQGAPGTNPTLPQNVSLSLLGALGNSTIYDNQNNWRDNNAALTGAAPATWPPPGGALTSDRRTLDVFLKVA